MAQGHSQRLSFSSYYSSEDDESGRASFSHGDQQPENIYRPGFSSPDTDASDRPSFGQSSQMYGQFTKPVISRTLSESESEDSQQNTQNTSRAPKRKLEELIVSKKDEAGAGYSSFAKKMMTKMGHEEGKGLGKNAQGRANIVEASKQRGRRGLGHEVSGFEQRDDISWAFDKDEVIMDEVLEWMQPCDLPAPDLHEMRTWMKEGPIIHEIRGYTEFCSEDILNAVVDCKTVFDNLESEEMRRARTRSNPYETIRGGMFLNRAAMKMANMDAILDFMFTNPMGMKGEPLVERGELLYFVDECAGPGGFSEYVLWRKKWHAKGFGFTLKGNNDFKLEDFFAASSELFEPHYGVGVLEGDGDIYNPDNLRVFREFIMENTEGKGVHFVMADGGFSVDGKENLQEPLSNRLYLCQFLNALAVLRTGGHFVCKLFDIFTVYSVGLIYLMYRAFGQVSIIKPVTSRPANSERYIVCKWKRDDAQAIHDYMFEINLHMNEIDSVLAEKTISEVVPLEIMQKDEKFFEYIYESNERIGESQAIALKKIQTFAQNSELHDPRQAETRERCLQKWKIPDQLRTAPDRSERDSAMFHRLLGQTESAFDHQAELLNPLLLQPGHECIKSVYDYRVVMLAAEHRCFLISLGKTQVYWWDGHGHQVKWRKVDACKIELPRETIIEAEIVQEMRGAGKGTKRSSAVHVIDALVLGGVDVTKKPFTERHDLLKKFVKAISRPTRPDLAPIRVKSTYRFEDLQKVFDSLEYKVVKGSSQPRLCYCFDESKDGQTRFVVPTAMCFIKIVKDPWMMAFSNSQNRKYFFHTHKRESKFECPSDSLATYVDCLQHRLLWEWGDGVHVHDRQMGSPDPKKISKQDMLQFVSRMTGRK